MKEILQVVNIGCQGWNYNDWVTPAGEQYVFYPEGTRQKDMLALYSSVFDTVEVDSTFYASPTESVFKSWLERSSDDFVFSLKFPRSITHENALRPECYEAAGLFCERAKILGRKLGVLLIQLPPAFAANRRNAKALRGFIDRLPEGICYSVEFRDPRWLVPWTFEMLANKRVSVCAVEGEWFNREENIRTIDQSRTGHLYVRFMGERNLDRFDRVQRPQDGLLEQWCEELRSAKDGELYVYVSNLLEGFAPATVNKLRKLFGLPESDPSRLKVQERLF